MAVRHPDRFLPLEEYNFDHFRSIHLLRDVWRTLTSQGIQPGEVAPDFALTTTDGQTLRLSELRGRPALLHFTSYT